VGRCARAFNWRLLFEPTARATNVSIGRDETQSMGNQNDST